MGKNIDMIRMFGNFNVTCDHCNHTDTATSYCLDDIDVDDGTDVNPENGLWKLRLVCNKCKRKFDFKLKIFTMQLK